MENGFYEDFGYGFYCTILENQAKRRKHIVNLYEYSPDEGQNIKKFSEMIEEWLQFVVKNRRGEMTDIAADMHIGPVADDNVYRSIRLFETGVLDAEETVKRLKTEVLQDQWTFHTEKLLAFVKFIESKEIREE